MSIFVVGMLVVLIQQGIQFFMSADILKFAIVPGLAFWLLISGLIALRISRKFMGFVKIAETVLRLLVGPTSRISICARRPGRHAARTSCLTLAFCISATNNTESFSKS
ncbi:hypothetical protein [Paraburkholderia sp. Ac-20340]|uniref:hypothetical protein n=1 Tax=Paraburkholderia sp. Ac-20340 TaxID=2703888 RepID=UPI001F11E0F8|nr:hypothetical protein [Paraburkholderia sp. Ac-20340]